MLRQRCDKPTSDEQTQQLPCITIVQLFLSYPGSRQKARCSSAARATHMEGEGGRAPGSPLLKFQSLSQWLLNLAVERTALLVHLIYNCSTVFLKHSFEFVLRFIM